MLQSRACPTTTSAFERSLRGERHRSAHGPRARARPPHHRPPRHYCRGGHISAVLQTFLIQAFIQPADLLPSGLTGVAVLLDRVTSLGGVHIDISLGMLALNIPVALLCWSGISKRFVIFSMMQVVLSSLFLNIFHFAPFLGDKIMLIIFGGVVSGLGAAIALSPAHPPAVPTLSRCGFPTTRARPSGASSLVSTALSWRSLALCLAGTTRRTPSCSS